MDEQKKKKEQVLIRVPVELHEELFEEAAHAQLERRARVSVPSLVVEQLEFVSSLKAHHPEIYKAAKEAVEQLKKS